MINIIARPTILHYCSLYPAGKSALEEWYYEFKLQTFSNFNELKLVYRNASIIGGNRVIFNIKGNDFRLIIIINFATQSAYVLWFGTHAEYDKVDAKTVKFKR